MMTTQRSRRESLKPCLFSAYIIHIIRLEKNSRILTNFKMDMNIRKFGTTMLKQTARPHKSQPTAPIECWIVAIVE